MTMSEDSSAGTPIYDSQVGATQQGGSGDSGGAREKAQNVKDEAQNVAGTAADAGRDVASTAKEQAQNVAHETKNQVRDLYHQTQSELRDQAGQQQQRVASGLRSIGDELRQMASASESQGLASDLVQQAADRTSSIAHWLGDRDPGSLLNEVKSYARRNPGTFIAVAALAGAVAGRLGRSLASGAKDASESSGSTGSTGTAYPGTTGYVGSPGTGYAGDTGYTTGTGYGAAGAGAAVGGSATEDGVYTAPAGFAETGTAGVEPVGDELGLDDGLDGGRR